MIGLLINMIYYLKMANIIKTFKLVFSQKIFLLFSFLVSIFLILINIIILNNGVVSFLFKSDFLDNKTRLNIIKSAVINTGDLLSKTDIFFTIIIVILAGISVSMLIFFIKHKIKKGYESGLSLLGIVLSFFGVGCASCGAVILSSFLGLSASVAILGFLPLHGVEFLIGAIVLLFWSIYNLSKKIQNPDLCQIKK